MEESPIGRRVNHWRTRRKLTLQVLADRIGKSKSWLEKVERGERRLDSLSTIADVAAALEIDTSILLDQSTESRTAVVDADECEIGALREAFDRCALAGQVARPREPKPNELRQSVSHAWSAFQHARYGTLTRLLPGLLVDTQAAADHHRGDDHESCASLLGQVYQITSSVLRKLGEAEFSLAAAERAVAASLRSGDELLIGTATTRLANALLAMGRPRAAFETNVAMAHRLAPGGPHKPTPERLSVFGALLLQGAMAAAHLHDDHSVRELLGVAGHAADALGSDGNHYWTSFGRTNVELHRAAAAVELGEARRAVGIHDQIDPDRFAALMPERRAQHLLDLARALALGRDLIRAGEMLVEADRQAPAEIRSRPAARAVMTGILRRTKGTPPALVTELADRMGARV